MKSIVYVVCLVMVGFPTAALAQDADDWTKWPLGHRFTITLGAYFPYLDTKVRVDSTSGLIGTTIDFEQNLGMSDTDSLPTVSFAWRFARKHHLGVAYFELNRSGSEVTQTEIRIGDKVFNVNLPVSSFFDAEVLAVAYGYSVIFDAKKELALSFGLSIQDLTFGLQGNPSGAQIVQERSDLTAPLPTFGLLGGYAFTDKWIFRGGSAYSRWNWSWAMTITWMEVSLTSMPHFIIKLSSTFGLASPTTISMLT